MLEHTQEILERIDPLIDVGDVESAGEILSQVDDTSLRAVLIHIIHERGSEVADTVGLAYLRHNQAA